MIEMEIAVASIPPDAWLFAAFLVSSFFSILHTTDEIIGERMTLWEEFGRIAGVRIPGALGFLSVGILLPGMLIALAYVGYRYESAAVLSILAGARIGDAYYSHAFLRINGMSPHNPGLASSAYSWLEGIFLSFFLSGKLSFLLFLIPIGFFASIIPMLWAIGGLVQNFRPSERSSNASLQERL